ncbi:MAG: energy transducer TonB [Acidobacteria bacterium]|nr:energy transducer TonB [Acidobacteriota bacterium]
MSNFIRTSSLLLVLFSVAGFAQEAEKRKPEKTKKPSADGTVITSPLPAEYDPAAWKEYKSDAGRFSILFPGTPQEETEQLNSGEREVPVRILKLSELADYVVMYLDNPEPRNMNPQATRNLLRLSVKEAAETYQATSLEQNEITLDGYTGLFVRLQLPDRSIMRLKLYAVGLRIYQLMITTPPEQGATGDQRRFYEATADKFLNSFTLAPVPPVVIAGGRAPGARNLPRAPITGGILNGKAISKPTPRYPDAARDAGVSGMVEVAVTIDEEGRVITAEAVSGPDELRGAAVEAARKARFSPTRLSGQPVKVSGRLSYNFSLR